jgi:hypothetical protein
MSSRNAVVVTLLTTTAATAMFALALVACSGTPERASFNPIIDLDADNALQDGGTTDGGTTSDARADEGTTVPFCSAALTTANASVVVGVKTPFSLAETELVVAWVEGPVASPTVHIAERANVSDAFAETGTLTGGSAPFALERPILNPQGTGVAMLSADRRSFSYFDRVVPNSPFMPSSKNTFTEVNRFLGLLANGEAAHDAVWGTGGRSILFGVSKRGIFQADATLGADDFGTPKPISNQPNLLAVGDKRRRPSGVAPDNLVLFYFDEVSGQTVAASRVTPNVDFTSFVQLGVVQEVQVRAVCKNLYFSEGGMVKVAKQN